MKISRILFLAFTMILSCYGAALADEGKDESGKGEKSRQEYRYDRGEDDHSRKSNEEYQHERSDDDYFHRHGYGRLDIPPGHYPSPGECRVWHPDRPAGQQPPPGNCAQLRRSVPLGAWLIQHPEESRDGVFVMVYDEHRPGTISVVGEFEIGSGNFLRIVFDK